MEQLFFKQREKLLSAYNIPRPRILLAASKAEAVSFANKIGWPVALKICSPDIFHRSEFKGVEIGLKRQKDVREKWDKIMSRVSKERPRARIEGILVQEQVEGIETAIGMERDPQFGPVLMFGLGGIWIEVLEDMSLRIAPVLKSEAKKMIREIKGFKILSGFRGQDKVKIDKIADIIVNLSKMSLQEKQIQEVDFNPVIVTKKGAIAVDAKILVKTPYGP